MAGTDWSPSVVRVSEEGRVTLPEPLREQSAVEAPGEVLVYAEGERIVVEPIPSGEELHGIHAGDHEPGEILARVREERHDERRCESERGEHPNSGE